MCCTPIHYPSLYPYYLKDSKFPAFALKFGIRHKSCTAESPSLNLIERGCCFQNTIFSSRGTTSLCAYVHFVVYLLCSHFTLYILQQNATLTNREVSNSSADPANKAKLILLLGGFNNTGELESQLKRISMPPISSEPLHALMIMECHQHSYTVQ